MAPKMAAAKTLTFPIIYRFTSSVNSTESQEEARLSVPTDRAWFLARTLM